MQGRPLWPPWATTRVVPAVGIGLASFGLLNPLLAAFIHVSSEMAFILNSARLVPQASLAGALAHGSRFGRGQNMDKMSPQEAPLTG
jgi:hypothetical protein